MKLKIVSICSFFIILIFLFSGCFEKKAEVSKPAGQNVNIMFATDIHYLSHKLDEEGSILMDVITGSDGKMVQYSPEITEALALEAIKEKPDALIVGGDLTLNGEKQSHEELAALLRKVKNAGVPVLVVPGNHDINQPDSYRFTKEGVENVANISEADFWNLYGPLGAYDAISKDKDSLSYVYELNKDLWVMMLDTCRYKSGSVRDDGIIETSTIKWMEENLIKAQESGAHVVTVMHHNLLPHTNFSAGFTIVDYLAVINLLERYDVMVNLSGHMHVQDIAYGGDEGIYDIATNAISVYPNYYGKILIDKERLFTYEAEKIDVETIPSFEQKSREFFAESTAIKIERTLDKYDISDDEKQIMIKFAEDVNIALFSGNLNGLSTEDEGYLLWQKNCPEEHFFSYLTNMLSNIKDSTYLKVNLFN
ncbi:MAG: metallophosphoesterase [Oscillospiraceae bacterium]|nr:metallophosphoesterase [Oscillospiraceae bacterium]